MSHSIRRHIYLKLLDTDKGASKAYLRGKIAEVGTSRKQVSQNTWPLHVQYSQNGHELQVQLEGLQNIRTSIGMSWKIETD